MHALVPYAQAHLANGGRLNNITRHILGLYHQQPRGRLFRRFLSESVTKRDVSADVLIEAVALVEGRAQLGDLAGAA